MSDKGCVNRGTMVETPLQACLYCPRCGRVGVSLYTCPRCAEDRAGEVNAAKVSNEIGAKGMPVVVLEWLGTRLVRATWYRRT